MLNFYISSASILIPVILGLVAYKQLSRELRLLFYLCLAGLATEILYWLNTHFGIIWFGIPPLYYVWNGLELIIIMAIYSVWSNQKAYLKIAVIFIVVHVVFCFISGFDEYDPLTRILSSVLISIGAIHLFGKSLWSEDRVMSVIFAVLFFYFCGGLIIYAAKYLPVEDSNYFAKYINQVWLIHTPLNITMNLCFGAAFFLRRKFVLRSKDSRKFTPGTSTDTKLEYPKVS